MAKMNWRRFLKRWSDAILASGEFDEVLSPDAAQGKWAGFPPANEDAIAEAERRLKVRLPDSYRSFLRVSNGWWLGGTAGPTRLWSVEEINRLADEEPQTAAIWSRADAPEMESEPDASDIPPSHFKSVIQISQDNDGRYLLNPLIKTGRNECQAALFAPWVPGAECHESFEKMMEGLGEAYLAAHGSPKSNEKSRARNLAKPPAELIEDPGQFLEELGRLGYFRLVPPELAKRMSQDFQEVWEAFQASHGQLLDGPWPSPGSAIFGEESGRVADLDVARLATERGRYAMAKARLLLANAAGIELGPVEEIVTDASYSMRAEGITHEYFRLKKGRPARLGGEHESNAARYALSESATFLNKILKQRGRPERFATIEELRRQFETEMRLALLLLDDDLSYLFMWSPVIHNYCRPMRPDVF